MAGISGHAGRRGTSDRVRVAIVRVAIAGGGDVPGKTLNPGKGEDVVERVVFEHEHEHVPDPGIRADPAHRGRAPRPRVRVDGKRLVIDSERELSRILAPKLALRPVRHERAALIDPGVGAVLDHELDSPVVENQSRCETHLERNGEIACHPAWGNRAPGGILSPVRRRVVVVERDRRFPARVVRDADLGLFHRGRIHRGGAASGREVDVESAGRDCEVDSLIGVLPLKLTLLPIGVVEDSRALIHAAMRAVEHDEFGCPIVTHTGDLPPRLEVHRQRARSLARSCIPGIGLHSVGRVLMPDADRRIAVGCVRHVNLGRLLHRRHSVPS